MRILIVDDDPDICDLLVDFLLREGYESDVARNGQQALDKLTAPGGADFGLVLLDIMMPVLDGWGFLEGRAAGSAALRGVPVVVMTAAHGVDEQRLSRLGVATTLPKPFGLDELLEAITTHVLRDQEAA